MGGGEGAGGGGSGGGSTIWLGQERAITIGKGGGLMEGWCTYNTSGVVGGPVKEGLRHVDEMCNIGLLWAHRCDPSAFRCGRTFVPEPLL